MKNTINDDPYSLVYKLGAEKSRVKATLMSVRKPAGHTNNVQDTLELLLSTLLPRDQDDRDIPCHLEIRRIVSEGYNN